MTPDKFIQQLISAKFEDVLENREYTSIHFEPDFGTNYIALKTFYLPEFDITVEAGQKFTWVWDYSFNKNNIMRKFIPKWVTGDDLP